MVFRPSGRIKDSSCKSYARTSRWLKSYSCSLCFSFWFWSGTVKELCFTSITLTQLKFKFRPWTRYDTYSISFRSSILTAFCSLSFRNNKSRNQLGWIFCTPGRFLSQNVNVYVYQRCIHQLDTFLSNKHPIVKKFVYNSCRLLFGLTGRIYNRLSLVTHTLRHLPSSSSQLASQRSVGGWVSSPVIYWLLQASGSRDPMLIH